VFVKLNSFTWEVLARERDRDRDRDRDTETETHRGKDTHREIEGTNTTNTSHYSSVGRGVYYSRYIKSLYVWRSTETHVLT